MLYVTVHKALASVELFLSPMFNVRSACGAFQRSIQMSGR